MEATKCNRKRLLEDNKAMNAQEKKRLKSDDEHIIHIDSEESAEMWWNEIPDADLYSLGALDEILLETEEETDYPLTQELPPWVPNFPQFNPDEWDDLENLGDFHMEFFDE